MDALSLKTTETLDKCCNELLEYGDSVQILMTHVDEQGCTRSYHRGKGNWYARQGVARRFILLDESSDKAALIADALNPS